MATFSAWQILTHKYSRAFHFTDEKNENPNKLCQHPKIKNKRYWNPGPLVPKRCPFPLHNPLPEVKMKKTPWVYQMANICNTQIPNIISLSIKSLSLRSPVCLWLESEETVSDWLKSNDDNNKKSSKKSSVVCLFFPFDNKLQTLQKLELPLR